VKTVEAERKRLVQGRIGGSDHNSKDSRRAVAPKSRSDSSESGRRAELQRPAVKREDRQTRHSQALS
jgi:hypothetical protein